MSIIVKFKQYGFIGSAKRTIKFLFRLVNINYESFIFLINDLNYKQIINKMEKYDYSDVIELSYNDFLEGDKDVFNISKLELIKSRIGSGDFYCYGIKNNGMLVYSTWISTKEIVFSSHFNHKLHINTNQAILEDSYCHPNYRGMGYHSKMSLFRLYKASEINRTQVVVVILKDNIPALKTQLKSGFKIHSTIRLVRIFNKEFVFEKLHETN